MAKRRPVRRISVKGHDFSSWNFILFLTLAFILLVVLLNAMNVVSTDVRSKAGLICPKVTIPRPEDCPSTWKFLKDATNGCPTFICTAK
jgi:hypothetical protein